MNLTTQPTPCKAREFLQIACGTAWALAWGTFISCDDFLICVSSDWIVALGKIRILQCQSAGLGGCPSISINWTSWRWEGEYWSIKTNKKITKHRKSAKLPWRHNITLSFWSLSFVFLSFSLLVFSPFCLFIVLSSCNLVLLLCCLFCYVVFLSFWLFVFFLLSFCLFV